MIDKDLFLKEMSLLEARFGRPIEDAVFNGYYEILSEKLDNQQFSTACKRVFAEEDFFPSPNKFLQKVQANTEDLAVLEWEKIRKASCNPANGVELTPIGQKALAGIGGLHAVGYADHEYEIPRMRKEFMASYKAHSSTAIEHLAALPSSKVDEQKGIKPVDLLPEGSYLPREEVAARIRTMLKSMGMQRESVKPPDPDQSVMADLEELGKIPKRTLADEIKQKNEWLHSGDRILESEAQAWAESNPGVVLKWDQDNNPVEIVEKSLVFSALDEEEPF